MAGSGLDCLPHMVVENLFKKLAPVDRCRLAACSQFTASVIDSPSVWRDVTFTLDTEQPKESRHRDSRVPSEIFESLSLGDISVINLYKRLFQNVRIVVGSGHISERTFTVLLGLFARGVVKTVSIRTDRYYQKVSKLVRMGGATADSFYFRCIFKSLIRDFHQSILSLIDELQPGADIAITLPPTFGTIQDFWCTTLNDCLLFDFYTFPKRNNLSSLLKKLTLPTGFGGVSPCKIIRLILDLPNLQEIHVDIMCLSDEVLQLLSGTALKRTPLRSLVIRYFNKTGVSFPELSSKGWLQLTKSSPSLTVECYVVTDSLPQMDNAIKPETPLAKLKVICRSSDQHNMLMLYSLCKSLSSTLQHFHLSISHAEEALHTSRLVKKALRGMVRACGRLQHLLLNVQLCCRTLAELATAGRLWVTFHYNPESIFCCEDKVVGRDDKCSDFDCACSGTSKCSCIEEAAGFPSCATPVENAVDFVCPVDVPESYRQAFEQSHLSSSLP